MCDWSILKHNLNVFVKTKPNQNLSIHAALLYLLNYVSVDEEADSEDDTGGLMDKRLEHDAVSLCFTILIIDSFS